MNKRAWTARIQTCLAKQKAADKKRGSDITDQRFAKRAMQFRDPEYFKQESDGMVLDDGCSSNTTINIRQPSPKLTTSEFGYMQAPINRSVAENRRYRRRSKARELWDAQQVKIYSNGAVPLWVPWREKALKWVISPEASTRIKETRTNPTVHFLPEKVVLKIGDEIVFSRSKIFIQNAQSGEDWKREIEIELGAKGYPTLPSEPRQPSPSTGADDDQAALSSR